MRRTGLRVQRLEINWSAVEPDRPLPLLPDGLHMYRWERNDEEMRKLTEAGLKAHVGLFGSPGWVGPTSVTTPWQSQQGRENWPLFVRAVLDRYGPGGTFWRLNPDLPQNPPIAYQIWNEQNSSVSYAPRADPDEYGRLLVSAGREIRAGDRAAEILPGGMFATPQLEGSFDAWSFLRELVRVPGVRGLIDAVAVHPYAHSLKGTRFQLERIRAEMERAGLSDMPLQVTELGWSSEPAGPDSVLFYKGLNGQARAIDRALTFLLRQRRELKLERVIWFLWRDVTAQEQRELNCRYCEKMGLLYKDMTPKPAYRRFAANVRAANKSSRRGR